MLWKVIRQGAATGMTLACLAMGCTPAPDVLREGSGRAYWDPEQTKAPPPPDADVTSIEPPGPIEVDAGDPEPTPDARALVTDVMRGQPQGDAATAIAPPDAMVMPPPSEGPPQTCTLVFQVTTVTFNGSYAPRNVGAIWISDANARFVKSLNVWAQKRIRHLTQWESVAMGNTVDAVTSATAGSHGTRTGKWNCTGLDHQPVPDGKYSINVEFTERNSTGRLMAPLSFVKGAGPVSLMPPDQANFKGIRLQVSTP
jgi:hypothetical protein